MKLDFYEYGIIAFIISIFVYVAFFDRPAEGPKCSYYTSDTPTGSIKTKICEKK